MGLSSRYRWATLLGGVLVLGLGGAIACSPFGDSPPASLEQGAEAEQRDLSILRLLYSRNPVTLNPHLATGTQDFEAGRIVLEPLASANEAGDLVPILAETIPTVDNGGVATDGRSVTWVLRSGLTWADGTPLTADDVVFTYEFVTDPQVAAATAQYYDRVESVVAEDDRTVTITFKEVTAPWQIPFTGQTGVILPRHQFEATVGPEVRQAEANGSPVGTGPYQVASFQPGRVTFVPNARYRGESPGFDQVELVGGIAPYAAARQVLSQGQADFAHNLQVEADTLATLQQDGEGQVVPVFGGLVERLMVNPTDPQIATETGERSSREHPHPFLSDPLVRQAIAHGIDREAIAAELYGFTGQPIATMMTTPSLQPAADTPAPALYPYDPDRAAALLESAGWVDTNGNGIRDRDGIEMQVVFQTSVNPVRQATQAMIKESLEALGIGVEIRRVRVDDFFSADPDQTNSINHFYADLQAYTTGSDHPDPAIYLGWWTCDQIAAQDNNWQKPNNARYCNPEYDALWQEAQEELDADIRKTLLQEMNTLLVQDVAMIPIVHRAIANGVHHTLTGITPTPWDTSTWDIAQWRRQAPPDPEPESPQGPSQ